MRGSGADGRGADRAAVQREPNGSRGVPTAPVHLVGLYLCVLCGSSPG